MTYPYEDGDVTVIGPEAFVSANRDVISYQGDNYYRRNEDPKTPARWGKIAGMAAFIVLLVLPVAIAFAGALWWLALSAWQAVERL
jgi:hypothetical protein